MGNNEATLRSVPLALVDAGNNDRSDFREGELAALAASIAQIGLIQPIVVVPNGDRFRLVAGERRTRASRMAGLGIIPAMVLHDASINDEAAMMLAENMTRVDLDPVAEGRAYARRRDEMGLTVAQLAEQIGVLESVIKERLRCWDYLGAFAKDAYACGAINHSQAGMLCVLTHDRQQVVAREMIRNEMTTTQSQQLATKMRQAQDEETLFDMTLDEWAQDAAGQIKESWGVREVDSLVARLASACTDNQALADAERYLAWRESCGGRPPAIKENA